MDRGLSVRSGAWLCEDVVVLLLRGSATRWVAAAPQPGLVQIEIADADGGVHRLVEKSAVVDAAGLLHAHSQYPVEIQIACLPRYQEYRPGELGTVNVIDLSPWGVGDPATLYPVRRAQLSWAAPATHSDLSVCARQAVALVTFRAWRESVGLDREEFATLEDHLWRYATITPDMFGAWWESHPLVRLGPDEPLPAQIRDSAAARGIGQDDVRQAVHALIGITYGGLFGRIESQWSLGELETLGRITAKYGVLLASADSFTDSLWIDHDWGRADDELVSRWRTTT